MKCIFEKKLVYVLFSLVLLGMPLAFAEGSITVASPAGGTFYKGEPLTVTWSSTGISGPLELRLDYPGGSYTILPSTANDGTETITVPTYLSSRTDWHVVLTDYAASTSGVSYDFSIQNRPLKKIVVTSPSAGATLYKGDTIMVFWATNGISGPVEVRLDYPGYTYVLSPSTPNDNTETFSIPYTIPSRTDWHVIVTDYDESTYAVSNDFSIQDKPVEPPIAPAYPAPVPTPTPVPSPTPTPESVKPVESKPIALIYPTPTPVPLPTPISEPIKPIEISTSVPPTVIELASSVDTSIMYSVASSWASASSPTETAMAISSASIGGSSPSVYYVSYASGGGSGANYGSSGGSSASSGVSYGSQGGATSVQTSVPASNTIYYGGSGGGASVSYGSSGTTVPSTDYYTKVIDPSTASPYQLCQRAYEGGTVYSNGYILQLKTVGKNPYAGTTTTSSKDAYITDSSYYVGGNEYVVVDLYDSNKNLLKTATMSEGENIVLDAPNGDKVRIRACDIYYSGYVPPEPKPDCLCPAVYSPVCGTNGKTYGNTCEASCAGVGVAYDGKCKIDCPVQGLGPCAPGLTRVCETQFGCETCRCEYPSTPDTPSSSGSGGGGYGVGGGSSSSGVVSGSSGVSGSTSAYRTDVCSQATSEENKNICFAELKTMYYAITNKDSSYCNSLTNPDFKAGCPTWISQYSNYNDWYAYYFEGIAYMPPPQKGVELPSTDYYQTVTDPGYPVPSERPVEQPVSPPPVSPVRPTSIGPLSWASFQVSVEKKWTCADVACDTRYDPVCGTDGKTYSNACVAKCSGVEVAYSGECKLPPGSGCGTVAPGQQDACCASRNVNTPHAQCVGGWKYFPNEELKTECKWVCKTECREVACLCAPGSDLVYEKNADGCSTCKCVPKPISCPAGCEQQGELCMCEKEPICEPGCFLTTSDSGSSCVCPHNEKVLGTKITLHRQHRNCADDSLYLPAMGNLTEQVFEVGGNTGYWNFKCSDRKQEQCYNDGTFDTYYSEWCEFAPTTSIPSTTVTLQRVSKNCQDDSVLKTELFEVGGDTGYWNFRCSNRKQEQCYDDKSFDTYYDEKCTFTNNYGEIPTPKLVCPTGCTQYGTTCMCRLIETGNSTTAAEIIPPQAVEIPRALTQDEIAKPSTRISVLSYELSKADESVKEKLMNDLGSKDPKVSGEAKQIIDSHVDYVLSEKQGTEQPVVFGGSTIENVAVKNEPSKEVSINLVKKKMLAGERIRELLASGKDTEDIVNEIEQNGKEYTVGGVVVEGKEYFVPPTLSGFGQGINVPLLATEDGAVKEVGAINVNAGPMLTGSVNIYNKLVEIVSR